MEKISVNAYAGRSRVAAYHTVSVHGGVGEAKPHALVLMLMNAAKERMATARGCIERREIAHKAQLLHSCVTIIAELRGTLNMDEGREVAQTLSSLYDYMIRRLLLANAEDNVACITEVEHLLGEIRTGWSAIDPEVRQLPQRAANAA
jgi:flagellar protein FliS